MDFAELKAYRLRFRARARVELPCLPTVAIRSVFGMALREMSCVESGDRACATCQHARACAYGILFEPSIEGAKDLGVTDRAPVPIVMAPASAVTGEDDLVLSRGRELDVRLVLVGPARPFAELVLAALQSGAARGVGAELQTGRGALDLEEVREERVVRASIGETAEVELLTPLRLTSGGKVTSRFGASDFLQGVARRVQTVARLYNGGGVIEAPTTEGVEMAAADPRLIHVRRWSGSQRQRMDLPGVVGTLKLHGQVGEWWSWLAIGEWLQIGKGTSMGFGRYRLRGVER